MNLEISNKVALVPASNQGLGKAVAMGEPKELEVWWFLWDLKWRVTLPAFLSRLMAGRYKGSINKTLLRGKQ